MKSTFLTASLVANMFLVAMLYAFASGHLQRTFPAPTTQELAAQIERDSITAAPVHLTKR